jgi:hypothetical protein
MKFGGVARSGNRLIRLQRWLDLRHGAELLTV